ncbi:MAG: hypothetical protein ACTSSN_05560 [Candidatus Heimdallarchaeaceae archaeon]
MKPEYEIQRLIRCNESDITCTGGVVFIGDGHTGKTHAALNLSSFRQGGFVDAQCRTISKSINLEFEYFIAHSNIEKFRVTISSQLFIMPGQKGKAEEGTGLAFEDALDLYFDIRSINEVIVLVLTYNLNSITTFQNLEYWLNRAIEQELIKEYTNIILLGTHLDQENTIIVKDEEIEAGRKFISNHVEERIGVKIDLDRIITTKISNMTQEGIPEFQEEITDCFFRSFDIKQIINENLGLETQSEEKRSNIESE